MQYNKPPLTFEQQADLLTTRGLIVEKSLLIERLKNVNYYRLSGYLYPYRQTDDTFKPETTFDCVWRHYTFDRRLRLIVMDAIERIEISVRTKLVYALAHKTNAFGYIDLKTFNHFSAADHNKLLESIKKEAERSKERFVSHFKKKYGADHEYMPLWVVGEIMSFGNILTMYKGVSDEIKRSIAVEYGVPDMILTSWLQTIHAVRNICAHHSRLWNRVLGVKPFIPRKKKFPQWHDPVEVHQDRVFAVLTIFCYLLNNIAPQSNWKNRLLSLFDEYPEIAKRKMGFPVNWQESHLWK